MSKIIKYVSLTDAPHIVAAPFPTRAAKEDANAECAVETELQTEDSEPETSMEEEAQRIIDEMMKLAQAEAESIRNEAKDQAQAMLDDAAVQAETAKEQAREEGHKAGFEVGEKEGRLAANQQMADELQQSVVQAERLLKTARAEGQEMLLAAERQIIDLTLAIVSKVLAREVEENPMVILPIVKSALAKVKDQDEFTIRVNPEDYEILLQAKRDLQMMVGREQGITIAADRTLERGSCVIDTPYGSVDARIDTQMENVKKALQGVMP